jgi:TatD DNase family protein
VTAHEAVRERSLPPAPERLPVAVADAHTHLDACGCHTAEEVAAAMARARATGVTRVVTVADDLHSARWVVEAAHRHPDLYAAVALHPTRADKLDDEAKSVLERLAQDDRVVAIGETGLDHYWEAAPHDLQAEAFAWHIELAKRSGKALMIHDREAHEAVFDVLEAEGPPERVIFHCFSGNPAIAERCADAGFVMSFAGPVSFRNAGDLAAAAVLAPADLILVETDAPFLTPHPYRGKRNEPFVLPYTVRSLARLRNQDVAELCDQVNQTTHRMYGIRVI